MIYLSLSIATPMLGARTLFANLTWEVGQDQRVGLVGANGVGKSSSLNLIRSSLRQKQAARSSVPKEAIGAYGDDVEKMNASG